MIDGIPTTGPSVFFRNHSMDGARTADDMTGRLGLVPHWFQADGLWFLGELLQNGLPNLKELDLEQRS